jgi:AsmA protein
MRAAKIAGIALGALIALIVIALLAIKMLVNPNDFKPRIVSAVRESTGRELALPGELKLGVFPWLAVEFGPASLSNPPGFAPEPLVAVKRVALRVRLLPLLRKQLQIGRIEIEGLELRLQKNAQGRANWDFSTKAEAAPPQSPSSAPAALQDLAGVQIKDSRVSYQDLVADQLNLEIGHLHAGATTPVSLRLRLVTSPGATPLDLELRCSLSAAPEGGRVAVSKLELTGARTNAARGAKLAFSASEIAADLKAQTLSVPAFTAQLGGAQLSGSMQGSQVVDAPHLSGTFRLVPASPRELLAPLGVQLPQTRDAKALTRLSGAGTFEYSTSSAALKGLELHLDDSTLRGNLAVTDLKTYALNFDLALDQIDFDRYRPPAGATSKPAAAPAARNSDSGGAGLKSLLLNGNLKVGSAAIANLKVTHLNATITAKDAVTHIAPVTAQFYGGTYNGDISIDSRPQVPTLRLDQKMSDVDVGPLLLDFAKSKRLSGRGTVMTNLTAQGLDADAVLRTLNGKAAATLNDGAIEGFDLWFEVNRAMTLIQKQSLAGGSSSGRTRFDVFKATADINNGVASSKDLTIASQNLRVAGAGTVNLVTEVIDYRINAAVLKQATPGPATAANTLATIPVSIKGPLSSPKIAPDLEGVAKARVEQELSKHSDELRKKLQDQLLKGILK